jgi:hypothetical protein
MSDKKLLWQGAVIAVQPRIRLTRSFDQRHHSYLGYALHLQGQIDDDEGEFLVGIGEAAQNKHQFQVGDLTSGRSEPVMNAKLEPVDYYKTAGLKVIQPADADDTHTPPPWRGVPPELAVYRQRGHRRLNTQTYAAKCSSCIWGCRMAVEIIIDQWNPRQKRYRFETFCYGPKSCPLYKAGPIRKVPGRKGMVWEEEDWVDENATAHRAMDE